MEVGAEVGADVGVEVGDDVVGVDVGGVVGAEVGAEVGVLVGGGVGANVCPGGNGVGANDGADVGVAVGADVGNGVVGATVGAAVGNPSADSVIVCMNHLLALFSTVQRIEALPVDGAVQVPVADVFVAPLLCVRPSSSENSLQAPRVREFVPLTSAPVSGVSGEIANPTKLPPLSVSVYCVPGL